jgi:hypothetical protein
MKASAAERMQLSRQRRRDRLRVIPLELRDVEVEALVRHGLLATDRRDDRKAVAVAMGQLLDRIPRSWWARALALDDIT